MGQTIFRKIAYGALLTLLCLWLGCQPAKAVQTPAPTPTAALSAAARPVPTASLTPSIAPSSTPSIAPTPVPTFRPTAPAPFLPLRKALLPLENGRFLDRRTGRYYRFGNFGRGSVGFYPLSEEETLAYGAEPLPLDDFLVSPYAPDTAPTADGERWLTVYLGSQSVVCFIAEAGDWTVERVMVCSAADEKHHTPLGTHHIYSKYKYKAMTRMNGILVYAQYASRFKGRYLFHTVPIGGAQRNTQKYGKKQMLIEEYEKLGRPASHGCVRVLVGDAYWIYTNCKMGTKVYVTEQAGPPAPDPPALIYEEPYMNADYTLGWDPTDPDPENPYRAVYPEWFE